MLDAEQVVAVGEALRDSEAERGFSFGDSSYQHHVHKLQTPSTLAFVFVSDHSHPSHQSHSHRSTQPREDEKHSERERNFQEILYAPFEGQVYCPLLTDGRSWKTLNQTAPAPSHVAAVCPLGTLAMYADRAPGW